MIYLSTGANGTGKTLFTLRDVRAQQLKENRPVYYHGFEALQPIKDFGWLPFDPRNWQDLPDGSICVMDECQNEFPLRKPSADIPDYVNAVAQFRRKRGFDFWMMTPHPMLVDVFIRRLVDKPSWHRHFKRTFGADMASEIKWGAVNINCEKPGSGDSGEVTLTPYPKDVYAWYTSASLHTGKKKIPRQVWLLGAIALLVPVLAYMTYRSLSKIGDPNAIAQKVQGGAVDTGGVGPAKPAAPMTAAQYIASVQPRIEGLPQTAPRYDAITTPTDAPYPAACVASKSRCDCYTQQATKLQTPSDLCRQIASQGFFMDWRSGVNAAQAGQNTPQQAAKPLPIATPLPARAQPLAGAPSDTAVSMVQSLPAPGADERAPTADVQLASFVHRARK